MLAKYPPDHRSGATIIVTFQRLLMEKNPRFARSAANGKTLLVGEILSLRNLEMGTSVSEARSLLKGVTYREFPLNEYLQDAVKIILSRPTRFPGAGPNPQQVELIFVPKSGLEDLAVLFAGSMTDAKAAQSICLRIIHDIVGEFGEPMMFAESSVGRWDRWRIADQTVVLYQLGGREPRCVLEIGPTVFWQAPTKKSGAN
ncbi:MAG: hypothetical protein ACREJQ_07105 [bacterium]